jgi:hypothetical protein
MRAAGPDHRLDLGKPRRAAAVDAHGFGLGVPQVDGVEQGRDRLADGGPVRIFVVARLDQRPAKRVQARLFAQFGKSGPAQQRTQCRIPQRGLVEIRKMPVAAGAARKQGVAYIV